MSQKFDLLHKAIDRENIWTLEEVQNLVVQGEMQVWEKNNSIALTGIEQHKDGDVLVILLAGGSLKELQETEKEIEQFAINQNCKRIYINGRKGWEKVLDGYEVHNVILKKDLPNERRV
jgi:hypothetical protein